MLHWNSKNAPGRGKVVGAPGSATPTRYPAPMPFTLNDRAIDLDVPDHETLLVTLRERLQMTGTKLVCDRGECGACTVLLDGRTTYACLTLTRGCSGRRVTTIEGVGGAGGRALHPVQASFIEHDAVQCGFCTPGQVLAAIALLERTAEPSDDDIAAAMSGNLCRCGTYPKIALAIRSAATAMRSRPTATTDDVG
jgi:xanthine dehydrogenase YagT iron-sulfur-binding subunit